MKKLLWILVLAWPGLLFSADSSFPKFTETFGVDKADLASTGSNRYWVLTPGFKLFFKSKDQGKELVITVLDETKEVDGVETRIVEEKETENGELIEISRNYFAISRKTQDVFYFGEDVDIYKKGKVISHDGSWLSGVNGSHFGLMMPGTPLLGSRYYQEIAPEVAMDRAEILSLTEKLETPAGKMEHCLKTEESTPLEKGEGHKLYAPGIGLIVDGELRLVSYTRK